MIMEEVFIEKMVAIMNQLQVESDKFCIRGEETQASMTS